MPWLIVGLGNPGPQYSLTRHNIGFLAIDYFLNSFENPPSKNEHNAIVSKFKWEDKILFCAKPQTYMNNSGESVQSLLAFYKIPMENLIVMHDEIDIPFLSLRLQKNRGHGGHNGIRSISERLSSSDYIRFKLGVGRPAHPAHKVSDYVLEKFSEDQLKELPSLFEKTCDALESLFVKGLANTASIYNK